MLRSCMLALSALLVVSCAEDRTEVVLLIDSDLEVPGEVDNIEVTVTAPDALTQTASATFGADEPGFPRTLGVERTTSFEGEYRVNVVAKRGELVVVRREARFRFTEGARRLLRVNLLDECRSVLCVGDTTCGEGGFCERPVQSTIPFSASEITSRFDAGM